jgi:hypothetical protein
VTAELVRGQLVALGVASSAVQSGSSWVALVGGLTDRVVAPQLALRETAGLVPLGVMGSPAVLRAGLQVLVRGLPDTYAQTSLKAYEVWDALHHRQFAGVLSVEGVSNPFWLGFSDEGNPTWSLNFLVFISR